MPGSRDIPHIPPVGKVVRRPDPPFSVHEPPCRDRTVSAAAHTVAGRWEDTRRADLRLAASSRHLDAHIADNHRWDVPAAAIPAAVVDIRIGHRIPVLGCRMAVERDVRLVPAAAPCCRMSGSEDYICAAFCVSAVMRPYVGVSSPQSDSPA